MDQDWLFAVPKADLDAQEHILAEWVAADEAAAAITDAEAEVFVAVCSMLKSADRNPAHPVWRTSGMRLRHNGEKAWRRATLTVLRRWKDCEARDQLVQLVLRTGLTPFPDVAGHGSEWTDHLFADAYARNLNLAWIMQVWRHLHGSEDPMPFLQSLHPLAERRLRLWHNIGRITLRRVVYGEPGAEQKREEVAAAADPGLATRLAKQDQLSGALRQNVRRLQQDRKRLKERVRDAKRETQVLLSQARSEVAAARRALEERLSAQHQELLDQTARLEAEAARLQTRIAASRADFVRSLREMAAWSRFEVLHGHRILLAGCNKDPEPYRLLVDSLGGRVVDGDHDIELQVPPTFVAFEEGLRDLALEKVLIKCDGLYRRKEGRHGIAISGIQVQIGGTKVYGQSRVVCCGPSAGSLMAEYGALAMALGWLLTAGPSTHMRAVILSDCRTLLTRLNRVRARRPKLGCVTLHATVLRLLRQLRVRGCDVSYRWVPRDEVHTVDRLCFHVYRDLAWYHRPIRRATVPLATFLHWIPRIEDKASGRRFRRKGVLPPLTGLVHSAALPMRPVRVRIGPPRSRLASIQRECGMSAEQSV